MGEDLGAGVERDNEVLARHISLPLLHTMPLRSDEVERDDNITQTDLSVVTVEDEVDYDWYERGLTRKNSTAHRSFMSTFSFVNKHNLKRFSHSKVTFLVMDLMLLMNALAGLLFAVLTYTNAYQTAKLDKLVRQDLLLTLTVATSITVCATVFGAVSVLKHSKRGLIMFVVSMFPLLITMTTLGYLSYKQNETSGQGLTTAWNQLTVQMDIQDGYECCGFQSELDRVVSSSGCVINNSTISTPPPSFSLTFNPAVLDLAFTQRTIKRQFMTAPEQPPAQDPSASQDPVPITANGAQDKPGCFISWGVDAQAYMHVLTNLGFASIPFYALTFIVGVLSVNHIYD